MHIEAIANLIRQAKKNPLPAPWPCYEIADVPFAIYDDEQVIYIDHPNPPDTRPSNLMAATSISINDVETATIPAALCTDEATALPLAYHEGFHWFQHHHFKQFEVDMFTAMAFYPELDVEYRAVCRLEELVLSNTMYSPTQKLGILGRLILLKRMHLNRHPSLSTYERFLERSEGTAFFVEQRMRRVLYGIEPVLDLSGHGWTRFYHVGAAFCWLLESAEPDWTARIEKGESPGGIMLQYADDTDLLAQFDYDSLVTEEREAVSVFQSQIAADLEPLARPDTLRIQYTDAGQIYRAFNPSALVSLGDGRVLHRTFFKLLLPGRGTISAEQIPVIDHVQAGQVLMPSSAVIWQDGTLRVQTDKIQIELNDVDETSDGLWVLRSK